MNGTAARLVRFGTGLAGLIALGWILTGQAAQPGQHGMPADWTHRHVIFSRPANAKQAAAGREGSALPAAVGTAQHGALSFP